MGYLIQFYITGVSSQYIILRSQQNSSQNAAKGSHNRPINFVSLLLGRQNLPKISLVTVDLAPNLRSWALICERWRNINVSIHATCFERQSWLGSYLGSRKKNGFCRLSFFCLSERAPLIYRVIHLLVCCVWLDSPSAQLCMGWWEFGRIG